MSRELSYNMWAAFVGQDMARTKHDTTRCRSHDADPSARLTADSWTNAMRCDALQMQSNRYEKQTNDESGKQTSLILGG